jgi:tRNA(Ile)-lysidine synthase
MNVWQKALKEWILPENKLLLGCSGGMDSVLLLDLLVEFQPRSPLILAHFDHQMRQGSSDDALFVQELAYQYSLPFILERAETPPPSEEVARDLRRDFLVRHALKTGSTHLVLAHHYDDQVETILWRILRGTGLTGLAGMQAKTPWGSSLEILRPLLSFTRQEIQEEFSKRKLKHREDPSNTDPRYTRNRIRQELIPLLKELHPTFDRSLVRLAQQAQTLPPAVRLEDLRLETLQALPPWLQGHSLKAYLEPRLERVLSFHHLQKLQTCIRDGYPGQCFELPGAFQIVRTSDRLVLEKKRVCSLSKENVEAFRIEISGDNGFFLHPWWDIFWGYRDDSKDQGSVATGGGYRLMLDLDKLVFPLRLRPRLAGDRIQSQGFQGKHHYVRKILRESLWSPEEKSALLILVDAQDRILWVPGLRIAEGVLGREFYVLLQKKNPSSWSKGSL